MCFTKTWLQDYILDSSISTPGFLTIQTNRDLKKGWKIQGRYVGSVCEQQMDLSMNCYWKFESLRPRILAAGRKILSILFNQESLPLLFWQLFIFHLPKVCVMAWVPLFVICRHNSQMHLWQWLVILNSPHFPLHFQHFNSLSASVQEQQNTHFY